jgi:diguanylate cyclase (GGDEF)-like protein
LYNRRYLEESLAREVNHAMRKNRSIAVVMLDLDNYKRFNDTFGHQAGDLLLREIGGILKTRVRAADLACRYGGEEFAVILSEVDSDGARTCVEILREQIKHLPLQYRGQALSSVTVSAGIAMFPVHGQNPEDLIRPADGALYRAKQAGRDRLVICDSEVASPALPS